MRAAVKNVYAYPHGSQATTENTEGRETICKYADESGTYPEKDGSKTLMTYRLPK